MYTGVFEPPPPPPLLDMPPPPPPPPPPQVANDVWMKKSARRATAIERKSWFFMARDYSRAGFAERAFDAGRGLLVCCWVSSGPYSPLAFIKFSRAEGSIFLSISKLVFRYVFA